MRAVTCPTGCGSESFRAVSSRAAIVVDFVVNDDGSITTDPGFAEGSGPLWLTCNECGHHWRTVRDLPITLYVEER